MAFLQRSFINWLHFLHSFPTFLTPKNFKMSQIITFKVLKKARSLVTIFKNLVHCEESSRRVSVPGISSAQEYDSNVYLWPLALCSSFQEVATCFSSELLVRSHHADKCGYSLCLTWGTLAAPGQFGVRRAAKQTGWSCSVWSRAFTMGSGSFRPESYQESLFPLLVKPCL